MKKHSVATRQKGFTAIELMITLVIAGILVTVGVPSIKAFLQNNRLIAASNELVSAFNIARSEAIKLNSRVTICESSDGSTCDTSGSWKDGWIVFIDADGNLSGTGAPCANNTTDCILRIHEGYDDDLMSMSGVDDNSAVVSAYTFTSRGLPRDAVGAERSGNFSICMFDSSNNVIASRAVVLGFSGRVRVSRDAAVIACPATP